MPRRPHRLTLARAAWLQAVTFGATHFIDYPHQIVRLQREGRQLLFATRNGEFPIPAVGNWPRPVQVRAVEFRRRPWESLADAPLTLSFEDGRLRIGTVELSIVIPAKLVA